MDSTSVSDLPCPFCGKVVAVLSWASESDPAWDFSGEDRCSVVCDASAPDGPGGCGASTGYHSSPELALAAWGMRSHSWFSVARLRERLRQVDWFAVKDAVIVGVISLSVALVLIWFLIATFSNPMFYVIWAGIAGVVGLWFMAEGTRELWATRPHTVVAWGLGIAKRLAHAVVGGVAVGLLLALLLALGGPPSELGECASGRLDC